MVEILGIRCANHLRDSCRLTGVNPHFSAPGADTISKLAAVDLLCRHRYVSGPLAIVTSQWPIVPMGFYRRMALRSTSLRDGDNLRSREFFGVWRHNFAYRGRIIHCSSRSERQPLFWAGNECWLRQCFSIPWIVQTSYRQYFASRDLKAFNVIAHKVRSGPLLVTWINFNPSMNM